MIADPLLPGTIVTCPSGKRAKLHRFDRIEHKWSAVYIDNMEPTILDPKHITRVEYDGNVAGKIEVHPSVWSGMAEE